MEYFIHIAIIFSIFGIVALSLNLIIGETGLFSVCQAAFFGIGAYTTAILNKNYNWNFFLTLLIGIFISGIISLFIGFVLSKFKGDYFYIGSFGFNIIVYSLFLNWNSLTNGPLGISSIDRPKIFNFEFSENIYFFLLGFLFLIGVYFICRFIKKSSFGRVLNVIREDEKVASVFGYKIKNFKLFIFIVSAILASIAGSFYASYISFIDPSSFSLSESIFIFSAIILGGLASNKGVLVGTLFLILLPEILRFVGFPDIVAAQMRQIIYGLALILFMIYKPTGLFGKYRF